MFPFRFVSRIAPVIVLAALGSINAAPPVVPTSAPAAPVDIDDVPLRAPAVGKPQDRIGAGARDKHGDTDPEVFLIAPTCTHGTATPQPVLYWFLTRDSDVDIDFVIVEAAEDDKPHASAPIVLKKKYEGDQKAGLHPLNLADERISLKLNTQYKITVMLNLSNDNSRNPYSSGYVEYIPRPAGLGEHPTGADCAGAGLWYDAIDTLARELKQPADALHARRQLCGLLWTEHVFYALPTGVAAQQVDAEAKKLARDREAERLKKFDASISAPPTGK